MTNESSWNFHEEKYEHFVKTIYFHLQFRQKRRKVDVKFHEENDTVSYRQIMSYFFQPKMSAGLLNDTVVMINLPLMVSS